MRRGSTGKKEIQEAHTERSNLTITHPSSFTDAIEILMNIRNSGCVVVNFAAMPEEEKQRMLDYIQGASDALKISGAQIAADAYLYADPAVAQLDTEQFRKL